MRFRDLDPEAIARVTRRGGAHGITHLRSAHGLRSARLLRVQVHGALIASPSRVARRRPGGLLSPSFTAVSASTMRRTLAGELCV